MTRAAAEVRESARGPGPGARATCAMTHGTRNAAPPRPAAPALGGRYMGTVAPHNRLDGPHGCQLLGLVTMLRPQQDML